MWFQEYTLLQIVCNLISLITFLLMLREDPSRIIWVVHATNAVISSALALRRMTKNQKKNRKGDNRMILPVGRHGWENGRFLPGTILIYASDDNGESWYKTQEIQIHSSVTGPTAIASSCTTAWNRGSYSWKVGGFGAISAPSLAIRGKAFQATVA